MVRFLKSPQLQLLAAVLLLSSASTNFAATTSSPSVLQVVSATYGIPGSQKDVTSIVAAKIVDGRLDFTASNTEMGGDPAFGKAKKLRLKISVNGKEVEKVFQENDRVSIASSARTPNPPQIGETNNSQPTAEAISSASDAPSPTQAIHIPRVLVVGGQKYEDATYVSHDEAKLKMKHKFGIANLYIGDLPTKIQQELGFDAVKADASLKRETSARAAKQAKAEAEATAKVVESMTRTIREVETDQPSYVGKPFMLHGTIDISSYYNCGYLDAEATHYAFEICQPKLGRYFAAAYMLRSNAEGLRKQILENGGPIEGSFTVTILPSRYESSGSLFLELLGVSHPLDSDSSKQ